MPRRILNLCSFGLLFLLIGCSNGRGSLDEQPSTPPPAGTANPPPTGTDVPAPTPPTAPPQSGNTFAVVGSVNGLVGTGLVLRLNGSHDLTVTSNGVFSFTARLASGSPYAVTVRTSPSIPAQSCSVENGRGTVTSGDITSVRVSCGGARRSRWAGT